MRKVYIHLGTHKTGTTAIQKLLANSEVELRAGGVLYPRAGRGGLTPENHHILALALRDGNNAVGESVLAEIEKAECPTVVISSEMLMEFDSREGLADLFSDFEVRIVMFVRRQDYRAESSYSQEIKDWTRFCGLPREHYACRGYSRFLDYDFHLHRYSVVFGERSITVVVHESTQHRSAIFRDFFRVLGVGWSDGFLTRVGKHENERLGRDCLEFKRLANALTLAPDIDRELAHCLTQVSINTQLGRESVLPPAYRSGILQAYSDSNNAVAERLLGRKELFTEAPPDPDSPWEPYGGLSAERFAFHLHAIEEEGFDRKELGRIARGIDLERSAKDWANAWTE